MREGWEIKRLGDLTTAINGLWVGKKPPFVNIAVIRNTNFTKDCRLDTTDIAFIDAEVKHFSTRKLQCGDIIIEKSGGSDKQPVGRPVIFNIPNGDYSFSNFTSTLRINNKEEITPAFLHKVLFAIYRSGKTASMQSKTTGIRNLDFKSYLKLPIPVPPVQEQENIVAELDCLTGIIEKKKQQLKELDNLAQSIFYDMFGDPITNEKGWEKKKLKEVAEIVGGSTPKTNVEEYWNGENPWVAPAELHQNHYISSTERGISNEAAKNMTLLPVGSVLLSSRAPIGKVSITTIPMYCNQGFKNVVCSKRLNNEYVYQLLLGKTEYLNSLGTGATFKEISKKTTENIAIAVPPIELQEVFAEQSKAIEKQKELIKKSIQETETLFNSRMDYWFN